MRYRAVELLTKDAPARIADLLQLGVDFDREPNGELELGREGAHSANRILHAGGDATGFQSKRVWRRQYESSSYEVLEEHFATELEVENGRVIGVSLLNRKA